MNLNERVVTGITSANISKKHRINRQIKAKEVRLIDEEGNQLGIVPLIDALNAAAEAGVDLVEINPTSKPPVCKVMDYGKFRYEQSKKDRESRQKRHNIDLKELKMRPKIDAHDYDTKKKTAIRILKGGDKVKVTLTFRGREVVYTKQGIELLNKLSQELAEISTIERAPKSEGKNMTMILAPKSQD